MREMLERAVLPDLRRRSGETAAIVSRTLRTWGQSESGLNEMLADYIDELERARSTTLAFLASGIEGLKVRLTAKASSAAAAIAVLDAEEARLRVLLGSLVFGVDDDTMESVVLQLLRDRDLTLGLAESVTGGLVAARLTDIAGASDVLRGSIVSYSSEVKFDVLGVPRGPVVSAETAMAMAQAAQRVLGADLGLSLTGVAGPTEQDGQPVGTVFIGLAIRDDVTTQQVRLPGTRDQVRQFAVITALNALRLTLMSS
jgi:nicotinamide-nucleotide amidase